MPRCLRAVAVSRVLVTASFVILRLPPSKIPPSTHDSADDIKMVLGVVTPLGVLPFLAGFAVDGPVFPSRRLSDARALLLRWCRHWR